MDRTAAYSMIARKLSEFSAKGYEALSRQIDSPPEEELVQVSGNPVIVAVRILRARSKPGSIAVEVSAYGQNGVWDDQMSSRVIIDPPRAR
jgi:hypothetical protein